MEILERSMTAKTTDVKSIGLSCQASFNSDGVLTLRHRGYSGDEDTIIIFSTQETKAIFELFHKMKELRITDNLPF